MVANKNWSYIFKDCPVGFYLNELYKKMEGHILEEAILKGIYEK